MTCRDYMKKDSHVTFAYPASPAGPVIDRLHGVAVVDPYRWLEQADSVETRAWVDAQNALTRATLDGPDRDVLVRRLTARFDFPRTPALKRRRARYFFLHNTGLQNQAVLFAQDGASGPSRELLDPNALSADGTVALTAWFPSHDGSRVAYALSGGGSDRQTVRVRDAATGVDLTDRLEWVKFASIAWLPDNTGFYYLRFPEPGTVPPDDEQYFGRIYFHRLGEAQARDALVYERPDQKEVVPLVDVSADGRFVVLTAQRGASDDSEVHVIDRHASAGTARALFTGFDAAYAYAGACGSRLYFRTTKDAPLGRIVSVDADQRHAALREVVAESADRLSAAVMARDRLVVSYLHQASDRLRTFTLDGDARDDLALPEIGSVPSLDAEPDADEVLFTFVSFASPPTGYRALNGRVERFPDFARSDLPRSDLPPEGGSYGEASLPPEGGSYGEASLPPEGGSYGGPSNDGAASLPPEGGTYRDSSSRSALPTESRTFRLQPEASVTRQVWYPSRDGTRVSMFLVHRSGIPHDGNRPVLLSGYGGFNITRTPAYDPAILEWLDAGGIFALANLRGGGEYGEAWHRAGMLDRKQNVFDDFIAAAEFLIADGCTRPGRLAIEGGSNGGLLVAAVMAQRPDLFGAVVCRVPVADMLRYHLFTVGRFWIPEYGSADDPDQFRYLFAYSPYHNLRDGVRYPPTLVMTADTDDRVDPGMAKKFAARLQAAGSGGPYLIRIESRAGHGAGKPVAKLIEEDADILAFLRVALRDDG